MNKNVKLFGFGALVLTTALTSASFQTYAQSFTGATTEFTDGSVTTTTSLNRTDIDQRGQLTIQRSPNTDIAAGYTVAITQDNKSAHYVMKSTKPGSDPTQILGTLKTIDRNSGGTGGRVTILDNNGIYFGKDSRIDSAGIIASSGTLNNARLIDNNVVELDNFSADSKIINEGEMTISDGGLAAFVAPTVVNNGIITAKLGRVELAGSNTKTTVDLHGDGLVEIAVNNDSNVALLAENNGTVNAESGVIHMTTGAAQEIVNSVVNMDGVANASSATVSGGKIILGGKNTGKVSVAAKADTSGAGQAGTIDAIAQEVTITETAELSSNGVGNGNGGSIKILGNNLAILRGNASAKGGNISGNGGFIELSSNEDFSMSGTVDTSAVNGETGTFLLDPRDIDLRVGTRGFDLSSNRVYGSDIELWSILSNIDILARRSITVNENTFGLADGVITLWKDRDLTIRTTNAPFSFFFINETNNSGVIDLTRNSTYGANLEFKTSGTGSINILGATDNLGSSNIKVSKLTAQNGNITVDTNNGTVTVDGAITTGGNVALNATSLVDINSNVTGQFIDVNAAQANLNANLNALSSNISGSVKTVNVESNAAQIQDGVDIAKSGNDTIVNVAAGTYNEAVTVDKALILSGAGRNSTIISAGLTRDGVTVDGNIGNFGRVYVRNLGFDGNRNGVVFAANSNANELLINGSKFVNNADSGVVVRDGASTNSLKKLSVGYSDFTNNGLKGIAVYGDTTLNSSVDNTKFLNNGSNSSSLGDGDILFYHYNGDVILSNIDVQGNTAGNADYGIQIIGAPTLASSGVISLDKVSVAGQYRAANLGIQEYSGVSSLVMKDVNLGGQTTAGNGSSGWTNLFLSNLGNTALSVGNTAFKTHNGQHILLGAGTTYNTRNAIDATNATFDGISGLTATLAQNFGIENKIFHAIDLAGQGLVTWRANNIYVTSSAETANALYSPKAIQRAIDAASNGFTISVQDGTFAGNVNVNKSVNLRGAQAGVDARTRSGAETIVVPNSPAITVTADNVIVDGFTVQNGSNGIVVDGADNVQILNNIAKNNTASLASRNASNWKTGVGILVKDGSSNVTVSQNVADGNTDGIRVVESIGNGIKVINNDVKNTADKGIIIKQTNNVEVANNNLTNNYRGIQINIADGVFAHDNIITKTATEAILADGGSDTARLVDNVINGTKDGIVIDGGLNNLVDDNDIEKFTTNGVKVKGANGTKVTDNFIKNDNKAVGVLVENSTNTIVGGIGNTLRNRISNVAIAVDVKGGTNTKVEGNDIKASVTGVKATSAGTLTINKNTVDGSTTAIDVTSSNAAKILENIVKNSGTGVNVKTSNSADISKNDISNVGNGIIVANSLLANIASNKVENAGTAIDIQNGSGAKAELNSIKYVGTGIKASNTGTLTVNKNTVTNAGTGIDVTSSASAKITENTVKFAATAVNVKTSNNADVSKNEIDGVDTGIIVVDSLLANILSNKVENSGTGIEVKNGSGTKVELNSIKNVGTGVKASNTGTLSANKNTITNSVTGIDIASSNSAKITENTVTNAVTGISVLNGKDALVTANKVSNTTGNGINVKNNKSAEILNNHVMNAGIDGINVSDSFDALIQSNITRKTGNDGINVSNSQIADILNNSVEDAGNNGITVRNTSTFFGFGVDVNNNRINGAEQDGINIDNVSAVDVKNNTVQKAGRDGINISNSAFADIEENKILGTNGGFLKHGVNGAGRDGIHVENSAFTDITNNLVQAGNNGFFSFGGKGAGRYGIYADNTFAVNIIDNDIIGKVLGAQGSASDAIRVEDSKFADINYNSIFNVGGDAIHVKRSYGVDVKGNKSSFTGDDGIDVEDSADATIKNNQISKSLNNGIEVERSNRADINSNTVKFVGQNGVFLDNTSNALIDNNTLTFALNNGIEIKNSFDTLVTDNKANDNYAAGILVNGSFGTEISDNTVLRNDVGIKVTGNEFFKPIDGEEGFDGEGSFETAYISKSLGNPSDETRILNNIIEDNSTAGIQTSGNAVGSVEVAGNQLDGNTIGFLLEGGEIDISNLLNPNEINGGETAMRFIGDDVSLRNDTLGATIFSDQTGNYIELVDGALFNPGTPTIIDGLAASWDGIIPLNSPLGAGLLTATQRLAIENRLIDFDDNGTLGQILVGLGLNLSQEDVFALNLFSLSPDAGNVNVTFRGLPAVSALDIGQLASLEPAAGDTASDLANIEPAAGGTDDDLANIEPAAGEAEGCWASVAETGFNGTVNFSFGGEVESALSDEACAN